MRWFTKNSQLQPLRGYKVVAWDGQQAYSLYSKAPMDVSVGAILQDPKGIYLGSTRDFAIEYYGGNTDMQDMLLTIGFEPNDLVRGDPEHPLDELIITRGWIISAEVVDDWADEAPTP